uniref:Uncharacterized protein n=1 Tax=Nothoprocta perdicaria TaxID=30464 RepID=A0A8C7A5F4_NOTPE
MDKGNSRRTSRLQPANKILGILLIRRVIFSNHIPVGMHLLSLLLHYFDMTFVSFQPVDKIGKCKRGRQWPCD